MRRVGVTLLSIAFLYPEFFVGGSVVANIPFLCVRLCYSKVVREYLLRSYPLHKMRPVIIGCGGQVFFDRVMGDGKREPNSPRDE